MTERSPAPRAPRRHAPPGPVPADRSAIADALRTFAILAVVANHLIEVARPTFGGHLLHFKVFGVWGVSAFFVLSGFLLSPPYVRAFVRRSDRQPSARLFLLRRVLRIVPLYVVAVAFSAAVDLGFHLERVTLKSVVAHLAMLQNFVPKYVQAINGPLWTMPVDFEFYFALPVGAALAFAASRRIDRARRPRAFLAILAAVIVASLGYRFAIQLASARFTFTVEYYILMSNLIGMAAVFGLGILLAYVVEMRDGRPLPRAIALAALVASLVLFRAAQQDVVMPYALNSILTALSVFAALAALPTFAVARRLAQTRAVAAVASLAYAIYLFHLPLMLAIAKLLGDPTGYPALVEVALATAVVLLPIVYVAHRFVERPFLAIKDTKREPVPA